MVVEVKLARNADTRREIVAQIFDYVSDLTLIDFMELDTLVDGALEEVIEDLSTNSESNDLRKDFANHLRSGETRFILAVDEAPEDLLRIMEFLCRHTNLDVRLVEVRKYEDANGHVIHVPSVKAERLCEIIKDPVGPGPKPPSDPELEQFFHAMALRIPQLKPCNPGFHYARRSLGKKCQIRYDILTRQRVLRVSFKSWRKPADQVQAAVDRTFPEWKQPVLGRHPLAILRGKDEIISYATNLPLDPPNTLDSDQLTQRATEIFQTLIQKFTPVAVALE